MLLPQAHTAVAAYAPDFVQVFFKSCAGFKRHIYLELFEFYPYNPEQDMSDFSVDCFVLFMSRYLCRVLLSSVFIIITSDLRFI